MLWCACAYACLIFETLCCTNHSLLEIFRLVIDAQTPCKSLCSPCICNRADYSCVVEPLGPDTRPLRYRTSTKMCNTQIMRVVCMQVLHIERVTNLSIQEIASFCLASHHIWSLLVKPWRAAMTEPTRTRPA